MAQDDLLSSDDYQFLVKLLSRKLQGTHDEIARAEKLASSDEVMGLTNMAISQVEDPLLRKILRLRYTLGLRFSGIGKYLNLNEDKVKQLWLEARATMLKKQIALFEGAAKSI